MTLFFGEMSAVNAEDAITVVVADLVHALRIGCDAQHPLRPSDNGCDPLTVPFDEEDHAFVFSEPRAPADVEDLVADLAALEAQRQVRSVIGPLDDIEVGERYEGVDAVVGAVARVDAAHRP